MPIQRIYDLTKEAEEYLQFVKDWKIDATTFAYDRGCKGYLSAGLPETALAMKRNGIPALSFDCSMADPRDFDEKSVKNKFDIFLGSLGLTKLNA
jgi:benzoyl-CoA reductase/2-hydroxyglutaryl-CoA dehydratase subunit BcrC/BadD/HgdB